MDKAHAHAHRHTMCILLPAEDAPPKPNRPVEAAGVEAGVLAKRLVPKPVAGLAAPAPNAPAPKGLLVAAPNPAVGADAMPKAAAEEAGKSDVVAPKGEDVAAADAAPKGEAVDAAPNAGAVVPPKPNALDDAGAPKAPAVLAPKMLAAEEAGAPKGDGAEVAPNRPVAGALCCAPKPPKPAAAGAPNGLGVGDVVAGAPNGDGAAAPKAAAEAAPKPAAAELAWPKRPPPGVPNGDAAGAAPKAFAGELAPNGLAGAPNGLAAAPGAGPAEAFLTPA